MVPLFGGVLKNCFQKAGDPLLVNRQPTLHKPGIMAHTAKAGPTVVAIVIQLPELQVLHRESTIRLHYVCFLGGEAAVST